ncbi:aspartyl/glutamyl-tRNA amidotransferase subunit B [Radiomyces spectabilis]|uniref:aspartyl/glutamyl-tRNA amidotransferase subunit B n=1 Tax=Radiomyces spectabilis TaxID=64574 RepID=UPI002220FC2B|nr:aspartyl/glutamyl-tRNA amidotransferase subunit B [Radiomyces spectabilis]KAI8379250.1 aspartyl/glutamyl-tRNA amidotransferase subunit B [Radiomyces spectabilis]
MWRTTIARFMLVRSLQHVHKRGFATATRHSIKDGWEAVIGIEVHAQINSTTKLFSDTPTSFNDEVNTKISTVDVAFPGVQPRLNKQCVELAVRTALALESDVQTVSTFDRKHYFYPDLPQGYQITQQRQPIARGGVIRLTELDGLPAPIHVGIHQLQLEQDTGKSLHDMRPGYTLLDYNRAGIGLMEIVTKPDLRSSFEAGLLVKKLQAILRCVGSSKANMEEGSMRCDVNVSVHRTGEPFGTRCELKNLNSVRFLSMAIDAEVERQIELLEAGHTIQTETRGYDVAANKTFRLRGKETAPDYRYMPEPDLPTLRLPPNYIETIASTVPELPDQSRTRIMDQYGISLHDANVLLNEAGSLAFFEQVCVQRNPRLVVNWTLHELFGQLAGQDIPFYQNPVTVDQLGSLIDLVQQGTITGPTGKKVLKMMVEQPSPKTMPIDIVKEKGWLRISDTGKLRTLCEQLVNEHAAKAETIRQGEPKMFNWFVGQVMRHTKGMADPTELNNMLCEVIGCRYEDVVTPATKESSKKSKKKKPRK